MTTVLLLGFLLGMRHAMESDHVAAVSTLVAGDMPLRRTMMQGAVWGLGHALMLLAAFSLVLFLDVMVPERFAQVLEALVGLMLMALGLDMAARLWRDRVHFHTRRHDGGTVHLHVRQREGEHHPLQHVHELQHGFPVRALCVGMVHGLAGSAALALLTMNSALPPGLGLAYVALFGLGATAGMAILSAAIAVPLRWSAASMTRLHHALQAAICCATITIGGLLVREYAVASF